MKTNRLKADRLLRSILGLALGAMVTGAAGVAWAQSAADAARADPEAPSGYDPKPTVFADRMLVVTANPLATEAALAILRDGGSAVDAGIAAQMVLNVVEPQSSGVGGGAFALHWRASTGKLTSWEGRETAPLGADGDYFRVPDPAAANDGGDQEPRVIDGVPVAAEAMDGDVPTRLMRWPEAVASGRSIGAPGLVRMLEVMHERFGEKDWDDLFAPAISLAETGFPISPRLHSSIAGMAKRLAARPETAALFLAPDGSARPVGEIMTNAALAESLDEIADDGAEALHEGDIAEAIVAAVQAEPVPGALTLDDLEAYQAMERSPVCARYRARYEVCGMGPPSSGGVAVGQILGMLGHVDMKRFPLDTPYGAHLFLEASRLAYADRARYLADADFVPVPAEGLLDPTYLMVRAQLMNAERASIGRAKAGAPPWKEARLFAPDLTDTRPGTTHISIVDAQGDVFVMTSSIETAFGSGRMAGGFLLNNQLTDFSFAAEKKGVPIANAVEPRKRPRSSMAPTIVFDIRNGERRPILALGSPGGSRIIEYVAETIIGVLDHGLLPGDAVAQPHISHRNRMAVAVERRQDADALAKGLSRFGHRVERKDMTSGTHVIGIAVDGALSGGADPRREGLAAGE